MTKRRAKRPPRTQRPAKGGHGRAWWLWLAAILAVTFVVYIPCLDNDLTNWDDDFYVTANPLLAHPGIRAILLTPVRGNYHPLTVWSLALNYRLSGAAPSSYHWLNLLLHLANTALVYFFVRKLSQGRFWTTALTALFFGIHPMHVESVAWVSERKDVLYAFFYLIGLMAYLRYLDTRRWPWLLTALLVYLLSAASKPAAIVFPLTLLLLDWYRERPFRAAVLLEKVPFVAISAAAGYVTLLAQKSTGAMAIQWSAFEKVLFASYGTLMYFAKLLAPVHLSAIHPYVKIAGRGQGSEFYVAFAAALVLLPAMLYLCRRVRVACFGLGFFFINIILVLQIATVGEAVMAERYTYLPYIGLLFALAWWLDTPPQTGPGQRLVKPMIATCFLLMLPLCLVQTWRRCDVWQNSGTLWDDTIRKYPHKVYDAYTYRGEYRWRVTRRFRDALADFDQAVALNAGVARGWLFKGMAHAELGELDSAYVCFNRTLSIDPRFAAAWSNRGSIELKRGNLGAAVSDYSKALEIDPRLWDAYTNRALAYVMMGKQEKAIMDLRQALALNPTNPGNHVYVSAIGVALQGLGRNREAVHEFDEAIQTAPISDPRRSGYLLSRSRSWQALGDIAKARADAEEARRLGAQVPDDYWRSLGG